ncbi:hypothetical protein AtubIFM61612_003644 [Aspergillus tubingensis]|nr:hypothetical protein AtubIFM61612_003644 [Aspergillus tubingensis]
MRPKIPQKSEQQVQVSYDQEATTLLQYLGQEQHPDYGFGAVSGSIYDTAWVSMVKKPVAGSKTAWAFIECFQFLSEAQCEDGGWDADAVLFDRIACTLAGLLALKKHQNEEKDHTSRQALGKKIFKATHFLRQTLPMLPAAVAYELPIGAELWLPKMLELIEEEGIHLDNAAVLAWILPARDKKISRFPIETLYKKGFTSVAHSLEGLIGYADFNRVSMLKTCGSMMGSPSATAAYLIYSENWDADAEAYIRRALNCPHAGQNGGVPSTYPTTAFESSWIVVTLLKNKVPLSKETEPLVRNIGLKVNDMLKAQDEVVGFAPGMCVDADDTAKALLLLRLLGLPACPDSLISKFESHDHFLTFGIERNPSVSTNAHVLMALLHMENNSRYIFQIEKCVRFLCHAWWESDGFLQDKWVRNWLYHQMLGSIEQMLTHDAFATSSSTGLDARIPLVVHQALTKLLRTQNADGSWGPRSSLEETSYATLAIKRLLTLPFRGELRDASLTAIEQAESYLRYTCSRGYISIRERLWIDKTLYSIETVSRSYIISATLAPTPNIQASETLGGLFNIPGSVIQKQGNFLRTLPSFSHIPSWVLEASVREGYMIIDELRKIDFFSQRAKLSEEYLLYCASCFVASNYKGSYFLSTGYLLMVLRITVATYQLDTFVDHQVINFSSLELDELEDFIQKKLHTGRCLSTGPDATHELNECNGEQHARVKEAKAMFLSFMNFVLTDTTGPVSTYNKLNLRSELRSALLAQIGHIRSSKGLAHEGVDLHDQIGKTTFFSWLRGPASDNVLYPVVLKYMILHMGMSQAQQDDDVFRTPEEQYIVEDFCRHAAAGVRLWNDYGSIERDKAEGVLNSIDVLNLSSSRPLANGITGDTLDRHCKVVSLKKMAHYENRHVRLCLEQLETVLQENDAHRASSIMSRLHMHATVTQVWAEMYSLRQFSAASPQTSSKKIGITGSATLPPLRPAWGGDRSA